MQLMALIQKLCIFDHMLIGPKTKKHLENFGFFVTTYVSPFYHKLNFSTEIYSS